MYYVNDKKCLLNKEKKSVRESWLSFEFQKTVNHLQEDIILTN